MRLIPAKNLPLGFVTCRSRPNHLVLRTARGVKVVGIDFSRGHEIIEKLHERLKIGLHRQKLRRRIGRAKLGPVVHTVRRNNIEDVAVVLDNPGDTELREHRRVLRDSRKRDLYSDYLLAKFYAGRRPYLIFPLCDRFQPLPLVQGRAEIVY